MRNATKRFGWIFAMMLLLGLVSGVAWAANSDGPNCFSLFKADARGHDWGNAYLLNLAAYYTAEDFSGAKNWEDFKKKFQQRFSGYGLKKFDFINIRKGTGDTQAMIMSNDQVVVVVFRGSEVRTGDSPVKLVYDWILTDINMVFKGVPAWGKEVKVHTGFWNALDIVYNDLKRAIAAHRGRSSKKVWLGGYSLGGGLATLAALRLHLDRVPVHGLYTYGCPRVGNAALVSLFNSKLPGYQRWVYDHDLVPMACLEVLGYRHAGVLNNIYADGSIKLNDRPFTGMGKPESHNPTMYLKHIFAGLPASDQAKMPAPPQISKVVPDLSLVADYAARLAKYGLDKIPEVVPVPPPMPGSPGNRPTSPGPRKPPSIPVGPRMPPR